MSNARLFILDQQVDIDPSTVVALNIQVNDFGELKDRQQYYSNRFNALFTDNNHSIFEYAGRITSASRTASRLMPATLHLAGNIYAGRIFVDKSTGKYELQFVSGNAVFFEEIKGKKLSDIYLSDLDLTWDFNTVMDLVDNPYLSDIAFIVTDDGTLDVSARTIDIRKQFFSLRKHILVKRIIEQAGFTYTGSLFADPLFLQMVMPFTNDYPRRDGDLTVKAYMLDDQTQTLVNAQSFNVAFDDDNITGTDTDNQWTISGLDTYYEPTIAKDVDVKLYVAGQTIFYSSATSNSVIIELIEEGASTTNVIATLGTIVPNNSGFFNFSYSGKLFPSIGSKYRVRVRAAGPAINVKVRIIKGSGSLRTRFEVTRTDVLPYGEVWEWKYNMPDMTQSEFLKGIMNQTCSLVDVDVVNRIVRIELFDEVTNEDSKQNAVSIDQFIASDEATTEFHPSTYAQNNWLRYKSDDNVTDEIGDGKFNISDDTLEFEKTLLTLPFAASDQVVRMDGVSLAQVARTIDSNTVQPEIRSLYYNVAIPTTGTLFTYTDGTDSDTKNYVVVGSFFDENSSINLNYDSLIKDYYGYVRFMLNNYKKNGLQMAFTPNFINQFDPFQLWYSQRYGCYFWANKINNYVAGRKCTADVIKL